MTRNSKWILSPALVAAAVTVSALAIAALAIAALAIAAPVLGQPETTTPPSTSYSTLAPGTSSTLAPGTSSTPVPTPALTPVPKATVHPPARWTLRFGGDSLLTRGVAASADPFARIRPPLAGADLAIVNVETAVGTTGRAAIKTYTFQSPPVFARMLASAGVDVASLANNHSLDYGVGAMVETAQNLRAAGVSPVGAGLNRAEALTPATRVIQGVRVAVLGASQIIPNAGWVAGDNRPGIASAGKHVIDANTQYVVRAVAAARATHDVVVVVMHWGIEGDPCPSAVQRQLARLLRAAGATAVLGAHPHILQPVVPVGSRQDAGIIAYSLGNFIWEPRAGATADTGVLELTFEGSSLVGHTFHPHHLDTNGWAAAVDRNTPAGQRIVARVARACPGAAGVA